MVLGWDEGGRIADLEAACADGPDLLIIGGGITGAGVLRDAAMRGLRAVLVDRGDFASQTSSATSKMVHGGLRYLAQGQLATTWTSCRERDRLAALNPNLVKPFPFLVPSYKGGVSPLVIRAALTAYAVMGRQRGTTGFRMLSAEDVAAMSPDLRTEGLRGGGLYWDMQTDDARFVIETLKDARRRGGVAVNHAAVTGFSIAEGRLRAVEVTDAISGRTFAIAPRLAINAAGAEVERIAGLDPQIAPLGLRPAKGVHAVLPRHRIRLDAAVGMRGADGRALFVAPFGDVVLAGTTDTFTDEVASPTVAAGEVDYLLWAINRAFPEVAIGHDDLISVYAGVRPLVAGPRDGDAPSSVSRDHKVQLDAVGLLSVAGGKLTTHRAMAQGVVDRAVAELTRRDPERTATLSPCTTAEVPIRDDTFERDALAATLREVHGLDDRCTDSLIDRWGGEAEALLAAHPDLARPIGASRYLFAEIPWSFAREAPVHLTDLLERRVRVAMFCPNHGLDDLDTIVEIAGDAAGWDNDRREREASAYRAAVDRRYRIAAP